MADTQYDLVVIGSGPGGYVCAIRAAQLGLKTACVEKDSTLGGTCLNVGCIPSKALLSVSEKYAQAAHDFAGLGIDVGTPKVDLKKMMAHKDKVVAANTQGISFLFKKNKVDHLVGLGTITAPGTVEISGKDGKKTVSAKNIVIATGSESTPLNGVPVDEKQIVTSTGSLLLSKVPATMAVIGGGVIGLEMGSVWSRLGCKVTVIEFMDRLLPGMDLEVSKEMKKLMTKQGMELKLSTKVTGAQVSKEKVTLTLEPANGGAAEKLEVENVLLSIGRRPYTTGLGLEKAGVKVDNRGRVEIDDHFQTNVKGIYAIGDVVRGAMLAHKAEDEGMVVAEIIAGQSGHINYDAIPNVVYTFPEVASIGKTEEQLKESGVQYKVGKFPFMANGRARAMAATDGFVKILADAKTDRVLGCHIVGAEAGTLIAEIALAMEFGGSAEDIARTCHAHPTLNEIVKEAALAVDGRPIHI
ncbi:MAG: dihydrolipoyl dehydrogenase [Alphaproteobacteria bacterium]|nr:MAG: dihydrolipoyl dehydrogenase [Alphaproteobacteria bacterium]